MEEEGKGNDSVHFIGLVDFHATNFDTSCAGCVERLLKTQPGVLHTVVDCQLRSFSIDYDSRIISDERIAHVAHRFAPQLLTQSQSCSGRLNQGSCETCILRVEKSPSLSPGVRRATASFRERILELSFSGAAMVSSKAVGLGRGLGISDEFPSGEVAGTVQETNLPERVLENEPGFFSRLEAIFVGTTLLLLIAGLLIDRYYGRGVVWIAVFTGAYFFGGYFGVRSGIESIKRRKIDVDILMVLAALGAAYVGAPFEGAMLLFLFSFSNLLQDLAISRTRTAIRSLMKLRPTEALCRKDGELQRRPLEELQIGDIVLIRPGEAIPLDSVISEGESSLDESSLTGESIPVTKRPGDPVFAGTINQTGGLTVRVSKLARDSTIAKLIRMVEEAQAEKANTQRFLEGAEQTYATSVVLFTVALILIPWLLFGQPFHGVFYRAMTVMVVASPCALIISTPASILSAIGCGARRGVLFKGGVYLEQLAHVDIIAFDKTGTLTVGKPQVTDVIPVADARSFVSQTGGPCAAEDVLLQLAASVEARSEHPLAKALVDFAKSKGLTLEECQGFFSYTGRGVVGKLGNRVVAVGNIEFFEENGAENLEIARPKISQLHDDGKTVMLIGELPSADPNITFRSIDNAVSGNPAGQGRATVLGLIAVADTLRPDVGEVVQKLRSIGVKKIVMLTGDHDRVAQTIGRRAGIDEVFSQLLPEEKVAAIRALKKSGRVAMVGDGINDAPALATADVGIAMGAAGTDVAMETADLVLMSDNLKNIPFALQLSRRSQTIIFQNLTFSLAVIVILVASALGFHLPLPIGVVGHEGSTVLVCLNGLRLLAFRG